MNLIAIEATEYGLGITSRTVDKFFIAIFALLQVQIITILTSINVVVITDLTVFKLISTAIASSFVEIRSILTAESL